MLFKKAKLERQLMEELKHYAHVIEFPYEDAATIAKIVNAYNKGNSYLNMVMIAYGSTIEKYPDLYQNWDKIFKKYKKLGMFPNWNVIFFDDDLIGDYEPLDSDTEYIEQTEVDSITDAMDGFIASDEKRATAQLEITKAANDPVEYVDVEQVVKPLPEIKPVAHPIECEEPNAQAESNLAVATNVNEKEIPEGEKNKYKKDTIPVNELRILKELFDDGIITEKEFSEKKRKLLGLK